jgi:hypothetical protein
MSFVKDAERKQPANRFAMGIEPLEVEEWLTHPEEGRRA